MNTGSLLRLVLFYFESLFTLKRDDCESARASIVHGCRLHVTGTSKKGRIVQNDIPFFFFFSFYLDESNGSFHSIASRIRFSNGGNDLRNRPILR